MGSVVNIKQLSRFKMTESSLFLLSLAALCCVRRWQGSPSYFLSARAPPPPPCRLPPSVMRPQLPLPPAQGGRGEPSPWTGWNPKEQFSRLPSRGKLKVNVNREGRFLLYWITTTSISTSTSFTITYTVSSAICTPPGAVLC